MRFIRELYLTTRFFYVIVSIIVLFLLCYGWPSMVIVPKLLLVALAVLIFFDLVLLFRIRDGIAAKRIIGDKLSNGLPNDVVIEIINHFPNKVYCKIIDEVPVQFQWRDNHWTRWVNAGTMSQLMYQLTPKKRGEYRFGSLNIFAESQMGLLSRRFQFDQEDNVAVYPAFHDLKKYELIAFSDRLNQVGNHTQRRIGHTLEFDQIKNYTIGDDPRDINWKASARSADLMINQYRDERSQQVWSIIDKGRLMKMPFEGLTLLDYAINATLTFSNIVLKKEDKAGLITFNNRISSFLESSRRKTQLRHIHEVLYAQKTKYEESDFELLYTFVKRKIGQRSFVFLYTNFESYEGFARVKPYLLMLKKQHELVIIFFENAAIHNIVQGSNKNMEDIYIQTIAEDFIYAKRRIVRELNSYGIFTILTQPKDLNINVINTYLKLKRQRSL